jgi:hypothetical protein
MTRNIDYLGGFAIMYRLPMWSSRVFPRTNGANETEYRGKRDLVLPSLHVYSAVKYERTLRDVGGKHENPVKRRDGD